MRDLQSLAGRLDQSGDRKLDKKYKVVQSRATTTSHAILSNEMEVYTVNRHSFFAE